MFLKFVTAPLGIWRVRENKKQSQVLEMLVWLKREKEKEMYKWIFQCGDDLIFLEMFVTDSLLI